MRGEDVRQRMTRERKDTGPKDNTHYGKAFEASSKLSEAEKSLAKAITPLVRKQHEKPVRDLNAKLERLTERDRETTRLLAEYLTRDLDASASADEHRQLLERGELPNIAEFIRWVKARKALTMIEERAIRVRLQKEYRARGERGRKPSK
jgi:hypothetical protein